MLERKDALMGYEFFCSLPIAVVMVLALVMGTSITLSRLEDWIARQIEKNGPRRIKDRKPSHQNNSLDAI